MTCILSPPYPASFYPSRLRRALRDTWASPTPLRAPSLATKAAPSHACKSSPSEEGRLLDLAYLACKGIERRECTQIGAGGGGTGAERGRLPRNSRYPRHPSSLPISRRPNSPHFLRFVMSGRRGIRLGVAAAVVEEAFVEFAFWEKKCARRFQGRRSLLGGIPTPRSFRRR